MRPPATYLATSPESQRLKRLLRLLLVLVVLGAFAAALGPLAMRLREGGDEGALPPDARGRFIEVAGHRVRLVDVGAGPALLLVHGFGGSTFDWEEHAIRPLAKSHRVIAVDLYGFGFSQRSSDFRYGWSLWCEELLGVLDQLGIERASIVGHSMGGALAAVFASRHPTRVERLVLADAVYPRDVSEAPLVFQALHTPILGELALGLASDLSPPGSSAAYRARTSAYVKLPGTRRAWLEFIRNPANRAALAESYPKITAPTLILHGTADTFVPYAQMFRTAASIRGARVVTLQGGTHFLFRDSPEAPLRELDGFL